MIFSYFLISLAAAQTPDMMPSIRRIGIQPIQHNLTQLKQQLIQLRVPLRGIAALPYKEQELEQQLKTILEESLNTTGRFWFISQQKNESKEELNKDYDLDAWLSCEFIFNPDHSRISVKINDKHSKHLLVREDASLDAQPDTKQVQQQLDSLMVRMISSLGHDGSVTNMEEKIASIDFGKDRGATKGQEYEFGRVKLRDRHPVTGEVFGHEKISIGKMVVLDAGQTSAITQVLSIDQRAIESDKKLNITDRFLVWKKQDNITVPKNMVQQTPSQNPSKEKAEDTTTIKQLEKKEADKKQPLIVDESSVSNEEDPENVLSWLPSHVTLGTGFQIGTLDSQGTVRPTSLPSWLFNHFFVEAHLGSLWGFQGQPEVSFSTISGDDIGGYKIDLAYPWIKTLYEDKAMGLNGSFTFGPGLSVGQAKTRRRQFSLTSTEFMTGGAIEQSIHQYGTVKGILQLNALGLLSGHVEIDLAIHTKPTFYLPKELGFLFRYKAGPSIWSTVTLGTYYTLP